jgi:hypothetical protein
MKLPKMHPPDGGKNLYIQFILLILSEKIIDVIAARMFKRKIRYQKNILVA